MSTGRSYKLPFYSERPNRQSLPPFSVICFPVPENGDPVQNYLDALKNKIRELAQESIETTDHSLLACNFVLIQQCAEEFERVSNKEFYSRQESPERVQNYSRVEFQLLRSGRVSVSTPEDRPIAFKGQLAPRDLDLLRMEWSRMRRRIELWLFLNQQFRDLNTFGSRQIKRALRFTKTCRAFLSQRLLVHK